MWVRTGCIAAFLSAFSVQVAQAEIKTPPQSLIACLRAAQGLSVEYSASVSTKCFETGMLLCTVQPDPAKCLADMSKELRQFTASVVAILPKQIKGNGFAVRRYPKELAALRDVNAQPNISKCMSRKDGDLALCTYINDGLNAMDAARLAGEAGVALP